MLIKDCYLPGCYIKKGFGRFLLLFAGKTLVDEFVDGITLVGGGTFLLNNDGWFSEFILLGLLAA